MNVDFTDYLDYNGGDEGKGKSLTFLPQNMIIIARFQGGPNVGHTLEFDGIKTI